MSIDRSKLRWNGWGWRDRPHSISGREELWPWLAGELGMPSLLLTPALPLEEITLPSSQLADQDRRVLMRILGADHLRNDQYERALHAHGRSYHDLIRLRAGDLSDAPDAVAYPASTEQVLMLLAYATERDIAVVPYAGGSGMVGAIAPRRSGHAGTITIDLSRMDAVTRIDPVSLTASAQGGIDGLTLERALAASGLTLGHFPQSFEFSTLGGWIAHGTAGQQSNRYGAPRNWLITAELATPRGMLHDGDFAVGSRFSDMILGSQGAFGIIVGATVRLHRIPEATAARAWLFRDFGSGAAAIREAVQSGVGAAMLRLSDAEETRLHRAFCKLGSPSSMADRLSAMARRAWRSNNPCRLIAEFEGSRDDVQRAKGRFTHIARSHGAWPLGRKPAETWQETRFQVPYLRDTMLDRGLGVGDVETATNWSNLAKLYSAVKRALETATRETAPRYGARGIIHCNLNRSCPHGASLHFTCIFPRALENEFAQWQAIRRAAFEAITANNGALTPGDGSPASIDKGALGTEMLRTIKYALDPKGILNPGKLIP